MQNHSILDMGAIEEIKTSMQAKFLTIVEYFIEDSQIYINGIREGVANENIQEMISPAHTLKSCSRQMGAIRVSEIAKTIEETARSQSQDTKTEISTFSTMLTDLESAFAETKEAFQHLR